MDGVCMYWKILLFFSFLLLCVRVRARACVYVCVYQDGSEYRWGPFPKIVSNEDCFYAGGVWLHHLSNISALSLWMGVDF